MKIVLLALSLFQLALAGAQVTVDVSKNTTTAGIGMNSYYTVGGVPFVNTKFVNLLDGTPYLTDHWLKGKVVGTDGKRYLVPLLKFDLLNNELHFLDHAGVELIAQVSAREMWLEDTVLNTTYHLVSKSILPSTTNEKNEWYQLLDTGKANLYKVRYKLFSETLPYGASTHEQRITTKDRYYVGVNNSLLYVSNNKDLPAVLTDRKDEMEAFIKKQDKEKKLSGEERWRNSIRYYNAL